MKTLLYSMLIVALVGGMVGSGLFAYFSDTETSTGNTFEAGTIDIELTPGAIVYENGIDAKPCETALETDVITNVGRNTLDLYKWVEIVSDICPNDTSAQLAAVTGYDLTVDGVVVIADDQSVKLSDRAGQWFLMGQIAPDGVMTIIQSFHIEAEAGNEYQAAVITLSKAFYGIQAGGPAPTANPFQ